VLSEHPAAQKGERFFGFFPNASHLIIEAQDHPEGLVDAAPHRSAHAPIYRQYARCSTDAFYTRETEDLMLLLRGLFLTSFLVEDFVDNGVDAERLIISSASSKTSIALAFQAAQRGKLEVVGLTSKRNLEFVEGLGLYDEVIEYSDLETLAVGRPAVFVDMAGNADVNLRLHTHLGDSLRYHCSVGATHWQDREGETVLPGVAPVFFFAPGQIGKRAKDWGPEGLQKRMVEGWQRFRDGASDWLTVCHHFGMDDAANGQAEVRTGVASPDHGYILSLWEDPS